LLIVAYGLREKMRTLKVFGVGRLLTSLETERQGIVPLPNEKKKERKDVTMRKLCFMLASLLLTAPVFAGVTVSCEQVPDTNQILVKYVSDANLPRAFGLDITVDSGATIGTIVSGSTSSYFWVYPGTIDINDITGDIDNPGTPVAPSDDPCALGGLGTSGMTIEMGSLYDPCDAQHPTGPSTTENLLKFTVSSDCNITIAGNSARGNVVLENTDEADATYTGCAFVGDCFPSSDPKYGQWVTQHKPKSWCCDAQWLGDATGDGKCNVLDLYAVKRAYGTTFATGPWGTGNGAYNCAADFNHTGNVNVLDLYVVKNHYGTTVGDACADIGDCPSGP
jgi:hypothetical protein